MSLSQAATEFLTGRPAGVSAVSRSVAGLLTSWVENGFNCTVRRDSAGLPYMLVAERAGRGIRLTQSFTYSGGVLTGMTGDTIPTVFREEVMGGQAPVSGGLVTQAIKPINRGAQYRGSKGRRLTTWSGALVNQGTVTTTSSVLPPSDKSDGCTAMVVLSQNAAVSMCRTNIDFPTYTPRSIGSWFPPFGVWVHNPTSHVLDFVVRAMTADFARTASLKGSVAPTTAPIFVILNPGATGVGSWVIGTDVVGAIRVEQASGGSVGPNGEWVAGDQLYFGNVYIDPFSRPRFMLGFDDVPGNVYRPAPMYSGAPVSGRSAYEILSYYGFRGTVYLCGTVYNVPPNGATPADIKALQAAGWSVGCHSSSHPIDAKNSGLRLLGPYGYNRSRLAGNGFADCRVTSAATANNELTTEAAHWLSTNTPITFTTAAPTGLTVGVPYVVSLVGTSDGGVVKFKVSTSVSNAAIGVNVPITADWTGVAEYRVTGSAPDDSAIYADIVANRDYITSTGITGHEKLFALPQGGWDHYVRTAVQRAGFIHTRGTSSISLSMRTISLGEQSGGNIAAASPFWPCAFPQQIDAMIVETGGANLAQIQAYVDNVIQFGSTGALYHHDATNNATVLDGLCAYLRTKVDAGLIDVMTLNEVVVDTGLAAWPV